MKSVSTEFMDAIYAKTRRTKVYISFPFVDPEAKQAASFALVPTPAEIGTPAQSVDTNYKMVGKVAQFEPDYWRLDGSFVLPLPPSVSESQYGYWSEVLSDNNRNYPADMVMRFHFSEPISIPGMTILFDQRTNNYLTDFTVTGYDESMTIIRQEAITGNTSAWWSHDKGMQAIKYLDILFVKSSLPNRRVRITEIDFGIMLSFEGSNLYDAELISEFNSMSESIPDNELNFSAENDGRFNYTAEESYARYLQQRQEFVYTHGVVLADDTEEKVDMGTYSLLSWEVSDTKVKFKARLDLTRLEETIFHRYTLMASMSAGAIIQQIFADCGWTNYQIAPYLFQSPGIVPYTGEVSCKEALRLIAALAGAVVIKMPDGKIIVERLEFNSPQTVDTIDYDNSLNPTKAQSTKYYNAVTLTISSAVQRATQENKPIVAFTGTVSGTASFVVPFDYVMFDSSPAVTLTGATLVSESRYSNYAYITVSGSGSFTYTIRGNTVDFNTSSEIFHAPWYQTGEVLSSYNLKLPMMISSIGNFAAIRDWCLQEKFRSLSYRLSTSSTWRQNPAQDNGDYIGIQLDNTENKVPVITTKHVLSFKGGALRGTTLGLGQGDIRN